MGSNKPTKQHINKIHLFVSSKLRIKQEPCVYPNSPSFLYSFPSPSSLSRLSPQSQAGQALEFLFLLLPQCRGHVQLPSEFFFLFPDLGTQQGPCQASAVDRAIHRFYQFGLRDQFCSCFGCVCAHVWVSMRLTDGAIFLAALDLLLLWRQGLTTASNS